MPSITLRPLETTSPGYESAEEIKLEPHKAEVVIQKRSLKELVLNNHLPPSPANSDDDQMPIGDTMEQRRITRDISRGSPGDEENSPHTKSPEQRQLAKKRSQYYEDAFAYRDPHSSARERVSRESMIMADVRTNVIIQDEYTFITDLSYTLSARYQRPESSVLVTVSHSACLLFAGSFDPAYTMSITALQSQLQPVTNKRNAALLQKVMEDVLGVVPERGVIRFMPIAEANLATNGKTVAGEIGDLVKEGPEEASSIRRTLSRGKNRQSTKSLHNLRINSPLPTHDEAVSPSASVRSFGPQDPSSLSAVPAMPLVPTERSPRDLKAEKTQRMGRRKSFITSLFGKGGDR
ncbi:hypothetical protein D0Z07_1458 [Hyphodiscus hymeniophilus]|uniref:L-dopachrome isomerase n=1 Tax=Hyphodiscus hymeniophilus TaxID=353542 RepID=A0A9P6VPW7_9HELO|nr:hypothetical protein D0Z07_1458 [Hyphodiscus hymeniophilus]